MKKTFICISFYAAGEKSSECIRLFGEKSEKCDKLIQFGTPGQHTKNRDYSGKTGTVGMFEMF